MGQGTDQVIRGPGKLSLVCGVGVRIETVPAMPGKRDVHSTTPMHASVVVRLVLIPSGHGVSWVSAGSCGCSACSSSPYSRPTSCGQTVKPRRRKARWALQEVEPTVAEQGAAGKALAREAPQALGGVVIISYESLLLCGW